MHQQQWFHHQSNEIRLWQKRKTRFTYIIHERETQSTRKRNGKCKFMALKMFSPSIMLVIILFANRYHKRDDNFTIRSYWRGRFYEINRASWMSSHKNRKSEFQWVDELSLISVKNFLKKKGFVLLLISACLCLLNNFAMTKKGSQPVYLPRRRYSSQLKTNLPNYSFVILIDDIIHPRIAS